MNTKPIRACLNPSCDGGFYSRGLCFRCYLLARKAIKSRQTTWGELIKKGKAIDSKQTKTRATMAWLLDK